MPIASLSSDKVNELSELIIRKNNELELVKSKTIYDMYLEDLGQLKKSFCKSYTNKRPINGSSSTSSKKRRKKSI